ncbi:uncharacterized protein LOC142336935 [Convolutriloba macropyga]|uniref:uncharacterized protein LOC142336935 n=1 Tax=Convolutriloba macropyga TaxID=536237 RepID=UPI003F521ED8
MLWQQYFKIISTLLVSPCICKGGEWESIQFQLIDNYDLLGKLCSSFSNFFCLHGYWFETRQSNRKPQWFDIPKFAIMANDTWQSINWFTFMTRKNGKNLRVSSIKSEGVCCFSQIRQYEKHGQAFGLSPEDYMAKITNFSTPGKNLNRLRVRYDCETDLNIILELGFGVGRLKIHFYSPIKSNTSFAIIPRFDPKTTPNQLRKNLKPMYTFPFTDPGNHLTFDFFKKTFVCRAQPWICETFK